MAVREEVVVAQPIRGYAEVLNSYLGKLPPPMVGPGEVVFGTDGADRYRLAHDWAKLPENWNLSDVVAVQVDDRGRVYVFSRGQSSVLVFDRDGNLLDSWGKDIFVHPHGAHLGPDGMLYCVDDADHTVRKCTLDGKVVMTLGTPGRPSEYMSGVPFCRPTDVALSPTGDLYVTDGYFNAHVHKFAPDGRHLATWGGSGIGPGQFNIAHNVVCDADGWVYVADRENHRIQVFDGNGKYETQWNTMHRPCALEQGPDGLLYVGELGPSSPTYRYAPNLGPRLRILKDDGEILATLGEQLAGDGSDRFVAPHGIAVDSRGDIYLGEVSYSFWGHLFGKAPVPAKLRSFAKLVRINDGPHQSGRKSHSG